MLTKAIFFFFLKLCNRFSSIVNYINIFNVIITSHLVKLCLPYYNAYIDLKSVSMTFTTLFLLLNKNKNKLLLNFLKNFGIIF